MSIGEIFERLKKTYCGNVGVEYLHIQATEKADGFNQRLNQI